MRLAISNMLCFLSEWLYLITMHLHIVKHIVHSQVLRFSLFKQMVVFAEDCQAGTYLQRQSDGSTNCAGDTDTADKSHLLALSSWLAALVCWQRIYYIFTSLAGGLHILVRF